jgi:hypothetical protein
MGTRSKELSFSKRCSKWWMIDLCWVMGIFTLVMFSHETNNVKQRSMSLKWSMAMITNLPLAFPTNPPCSTKLPLHTNTPPLFQLVTSYYAPTTFDGGVAMLEGIMIRFLRSLSNQKPRVVS